MPERQLLEAITNSEHWTEWRVVLWLRARGAIQVVPLRLDRDVGFVDSPRGADRFGESVPAFLELWNVTGYPSKNRRMGHPVMHQSPSGSIRFDRSAALMRAGKAKREAVTSEGDDANHERDYA